VTEVTASADTVTEPTEPVAAKPVPGMLFTVTRLTEPIAEVPATPVTARGAASP